MTKQWTISVEGGCVVFANDVDDRDVVKPLGYCSASSVGEEIIISNASRSGEEIIRANYVDIISPAAASSQLLRALLNTSYLVAPPSAAVTGKVSTENGTTTPLATLGVYTGEWEDVSEYDSLVIAAKTDQDGTYTVQFSPDGSFQDSTLTRYYRTDTIEPPHRFTITRQFMRVTFTNTSAVDQTYLRLQVMIGDKSELNVPIDSTMAQDFDSISVRPTDLKYEVALGKRQGMTTWNKFGNNTDIDIASAETIWSNGGIFARLPTAQILNVASGSGSDTAAGTGARTVTIYGIDGNYDQAVETVAMNGGANVPTLGTWLGVNRMVVASAGSGEWNAGAITATGAVSATVQAHIPASHGTTQQAFFFVPAGYTALADWLLVNVTKLSGGTAPKVTINGYTVDLALSVRYDIFEYVMDTAVENHAEISPSQPFVISEKNLLEFRAITDKDNTAAALRFSLILVRNLTT